MPDGRQILILDAKPMPRNPLAGALSQAGYHVAQSSELMHADLDGVDLAVIVLAPGGHGPALVERLRSLAPDAPVLAMTATEDMALRIEALERGAIDYLIHSDATDDAVHRIATVLHRSRRIRSRWIRRGSITLDPEGNRFGDGTTWTSLTPTETPIFRELLERMNTPVPKRRLRQCYPEGECISDNAIEVVIHRLRQKLAPTPFRIGVRRGIGYILTPA